MADIQPIPSKRTRCASRASMSVTQRRYNMNDEETRKIRTALELIDIEREELYERKRVSVADAIEILNDISSALYGDLELEEED